MYINIMYHVSCIIYIYIYIEREREREREREGERFRDTTTAAPSPPVYTHPCYLATMGCDIHTHANAQESS